MDRLKIRVVVNWPKGWRDENDDGFRSGSKRFLAAFPQLANLITETHQAAGWRASYKFTTQYRFIIGPTLAELLRGRSRGKEGGQPRRHRSKWYSMESVSASTTAAGLRFVARVRANNRLTFCYSPRGDGIFLNKPEPGESDARLVWRLNINRDRGLEMKELEGGKEGSRKRIRRLGIISFCFKIGLGCYKEIGEVVDRFRNEIEIILGILGTRDNFISILMNLWIGFNL